VFESEHKLRHLPFFEAIASLDEKDPQACAYTAGLLVMRLVDTWLEDGPIVDDGWSLRSVSSTIDAIDEGTPIRAILGRVVDALQSRKPDIHVVVTPLMAYGQALEYDANWLLAADVYHSVLAHLHPVEDSDASIAAHLRLGQCYRHLNRIDDASEAFTAASEIASEVGDMVGVLRARVGEARIAMLRGNMPRAEAILDETIKRAVGPDMRDVRSRALHDRANVAHHRHQYEMAIQFAYDALEHSQSPTERDRILSDIAVSFLELGVYSAARDAYMVLSATAQEQYMRWAATLNLLEISSQTGAEMLFELYRRQLIDQPLPPFLATGFQLNVGAGYKRFGDLAKARVYLERAIAMAGEHGFNQFLFEAEEALLQLEAPQPARRASAEMSLDVKEVAAALKDLRETVGA
jgi:tetratricopeptide (TPR) repeat protein